MVQKPSFMIHPVTWHTGDAVVLLAELLFSSRPLVSEKACRVSGRGRMFRKVIGYGPSIVIALVVSFLMIYAYTRLLTPGAFGKFSLIFSVVLTLQTSLFYALPAGRTARGAV